MILKGKLAVRYGGRQISKPGFGPFHVCIPYSSFLTLHMVTAHPFLDWTLFLSFLGLNVFGSVSVGEDCFQPQCDPWSCGTTAKEIDGSADRTRRSHQVAVFFRGVCEATGPREGFTDVFDSGQEEGRCRVGAG